MGSMCLKYVQSLAGFVLYLASCHFALWVCLHRRPPSSPGHAGEDHSQKRADRHPADQNQAFGGDCRETASGENLNVSVHVWKNHVGFRFNAVSHNFMNISIRNTPSSMKSVSL